MSTIAKKLQMKPGQYWLLYNAPSGYLSLLEPLPEGAAVSYNTAGDFDGVQLFVKSSHELADSLEIVMPLLKSLSVFWIMYPKKTSGIESDLEMISSWDELGKYGYGGVAAAAINHTWTALRFRPKELTKTSDTRNDELKQNEYSQWIDVDNRIVRLPDEIKTVLEKSQQALANYEKLSYSNRKEYVLWILTAKQEKTKGERLVKLIEKLEAGKKNPSDK
ncbi:YdeI/OmpD-associated family protein [Mucilaginibacter ginsenosidivorans]|uniref:YdeI/OmpD-associated family protein n=1 Tax=Mucilaginibacter ginsenosidivorans TaxID=398053 RepID=A0A5B8UY20_9SPHI|nr:YdeI/OmpD-associated family protein [Mucilaginibacter ginsenosidivorans]QEC63595.1 YdeI/OmpD-associated family protein [Mucilaginibacter ginsenosidivorans]